MTSSVIPARLEFQCGHAALVSLPRIKGESSSQRNERVTREKAAAQVRACDFCGPDVAIVVQAEAPIVETVSEPVVENVLEAAIEQVLEELVAEPEVFEPVVFEPAAYEELVAE